MYIDSIDGCVSGVRVIIYLFGWVGFGTSGMHVCMYAVGQSRQLHKLKSHSTKTGLVSFEKVDIDEVMCFEDEDIGTKTNCTCAFFQEQVSLLFITALPLYV